MIVQSLIINFTCDFNLPLGVRSTSLQLYSRIKNEFNLDHIEMCCCCIFIGLKIEDIQEKFIEKFNFYFKKKIDENTLFLVENKVIELLNFDFFFPNPYLAMCAIKHKHDLEKKVYAIKFSFDAAIKNLDRFLCLDLNQYKLIDLISHACGITKADMKLFKETKILKKDELFKLLKIK